MLIIDGRNIANFGGKLLQHSFSDLVEYPPLKKVDSNDWAEFDGLEVDLGNPRLDKKELSLSLYFSNKEQFANFSTYLFEKSHRNWHFTELGKTYKLRLKGFTGFKIFQGICEVKVDLIDDYPLYGYSYTAPALSVASYGYALDGVDFSRYGIIPLQGSEQKIKGADKSKKILEISNQVMQGVKVAPQPLKKKSRSAGVKCFMKLPLTDFWKSYQAFLFDLTKPQERTLTAHGNTYKCHYKSAKVKHFDLVDGVVWCEFELDVVIV